MKVWIDQDLCTACGICVDDFGCPAFVPSAGGSGKIDVDLTVDAAGRDWPGKVGVVTELLKGRDIDPTRTSALICGPEIMMRFSAYTLLDLSIAAENIHVSMERNMKCAVKMCGRCQYGPFFVCADGPVFSFERVERFFKLREV